MDRAVWLQAALLVEATNSCRGRLTREILDAAFTILAVNHTDRSVRRRLGKNDAFNGRMMGGADLALRRPLQKTGAVQVR